MNKLLLSALALGLSLRAVAQPINVPPISGDARRVINNAIIAANSAGGGVVQLSAGTYQVGGQVLIRTGVALRGVGRTQTILRSISPTNSSVISANSVSRGANRIAIEDLTLDGNYRHRPQATASVLVLSATSGNQSKGVRVSRVNIVDSPFAAMQFFSVADLLVEECLVDGTQRDGITIWDQSDRVKVVNNTIINVGDDGVALNSQRTSEWRYRVSDATITGNYIRHSADCQYGTGIRIGGAHRVACSGNTVAFAFGSGITVDGGSLNGGGDGDLALDVNAQTVTPGSSTRNAVQQITLAGSKSGPWEVEFRGEFSPSMLSNPFDPHATSAASTSRVQAALESMKTIGKGNVLVTGAAGGPYRVTFVGALARQVVPTFLVRPYASSVDVLVANNVVLKAGNAKNRNSGISARAASRHVTLLGNTVMGYYAQGISVTAPGVSVLRNVVGPGQDQSTGNGISVLGDDATLVGNRIWGCPANGISVNAANTAIHANTVEEVGRSVSGASGIFLGPNGSASVVMDNLIVGDHPSGYGIRVVEANQGGNTITGNRTVGFGGANAIAVFSAAANLIGMNSVER